MRKLNTTLATVAAVLLLLSLWAYRDSVTRADRFERGQKFLQALDVDQIATIQLRGSGGEGEEGTSVTLRRGEGTFLIAEAEGYPARNETVNRLLRDLLDLSLERELGKGDSAAEAAGLDTGGAQEIHLLDASGDTMVRFRYADTEGAGVAVQRLAAEDEEAEESDAQPVYLTEQALNVASDVDGFLDKDILDIQQGDLARIEGADFAFETPEEGSGLKLVDVPSGRQEKISEVNKVKSALSYLTFDQVFLANAPEVAGLDFDQHLKFWLDEQTGYELSGAERDGRHFLQLRSFHTVDQITFSTEEADEELQEKADLRLRLDELEDFNRLHGSWIYEVSERVAERLQLRKVDLIEDAP